MLFNLSKQRCNVVCHNRFHRFVEARERLRLGLPTRLPEVEASNAGSGDDQEGKQKCCDGKFLCSSQISFPLSMEWERFLRKLCKRRLLILFTDRVPWVHRRCATIQFARPSREACSKAISQDVATKKVQLATSYIAAVVE